MSMDIIQHLKNEHQKIYQLIDEIKTQCNLILENKTYVQSDIKNIIKRAQILVEKTHHHKEEEILFPLLATKQMIKQGGPMCSLHFGLRMNFPPEQKVFNFLKQSGKIVIPSNYPKYSWLTEGSPISIPLEEHFLGKLLIMNLKELLDLNSSYTLIHKNLELYSWLLDQHAKKEDDCLLELCNELLTLEERHELGDKALAFDEIIKSKLNSV